MTEAARQRLTEFDRLWSPRSDGKEAELIQCDTHLVGKKAAGRLLDSREWNEYPAQERVRCAV